MKKPPAKMAKMHQNWLFDYLSTDIDPYDFRHELLEWAEHARVKKDADGHLIDDETSAADLSQAQLNRFRDWLIKNNKGEEWVATGAIDPPAYLYFNFVKKLPAGSWGIHFTDASPFESFDRGTTLYGLALSSYKRDKDQVDCRKNLTDQLGSAEVVYGFAVDASKRDALERGRKYGKNAVLFQTDAGVEGWHIGDEEDQVIFPLCSEYNVIPLFGPEPGNIVIQTEDGGEMGFETLGDVISYIEKKEMKGPRPGLMRMWRE